MARSAAFNTAHLRDIASRLPLDRDVVAVRKRVEALEAVMERLVKVPGTNRQVGLDVMLDLVPVVGDFVGAALGAYLVWEARNLGMPKTTMARMFGNVGFDWALGLIPLVGVIPDFFFRSNTRNVRLIKRWLDKHHPADAIVDQAEISDRRARS